MESFTKVLLILIAFLMVLPFDVKGARPIQIKEEIDDNVDHPQDIIIQFGFPPGFPGTSITIPGFTGIFPIPDITVGPPSNTVPPVNPDGSPRSGSSGTVIPPTSPGGSSTDADPPTVADGSSGSGPSSTIIPPTSPGGSSSDADPPTVADGSSGSGSSSAITPTTSPSESLSDIPDCSSGSGPSSDIIPPTSSTGPWRAVGLEPTSPDGFLGWSGLLNPDAPIGPGPFNGEIPVTNGPIGGGIDSPSLL